jgi:hypothetical protein
LVSAEILVDARNSTGTSMHETIAAMRKYRGLQGLSIDRPTDTPADTRHSAINAVHLPFCARPPTMPARRIPERLVRFKNSVEKPNSSSGADFFSL